MISVLIILGTFFLWFQKNELLKATTINNETSLKSDALKKDRKNSGEVTFSVPKPTKNPISLRSIDDETLSKVKPKAKLLARADTILDGNQYVTSNELTEDESQIIDDSEMQFNTEYSLTYNWEFPNNELHEGDILVFTIPQEFIVIDTFDFDVFSSDGQLVGVASVFGDDIDGYEIQLEFTTDYVDMYSNIRGSFYFSTMLNERYVKEGESTKIPIPGGDITITVPESGEGGPGGGVGTATDDVKLGQQTISHGNKMLRWQIILGRDTILNGKDLSDLDSVVIEDNPIDQELVSYSDSVFAWQVSTYIDSDVSYTSDYITEDELVVAPDNRSFSHEILPYLIQQEEYAISQGTNFRTYELNYFTVPLDEEYSQTIENDATIKIKYKDENGDPETDEWTLSETVKWTVGGGQAEGDRGEVRIVKTDSDTARPLSGATFDLYREGSPTPIAQDLITQPNGEITYRGLAADDYYFIETAAPKGYVLPTSPDDRFDFTISAEDIDDEELVEVPITNDRIDRNLKLKKVDENNNQALSGAEFVLEKQVSNTWQQISSEVYTTDVDGEVSLEENEIADIGEGTYCFREITPPKNYEMPDDPYTDSFEITDEGIDPEIITKKNRKLNHKLTLEKQGEEAPDLLANAEFIIQGQNSNNSWEEYGDKTFKTNEQGKIVINNDTDPDLIADMIKDYPTSYKAFRFRETKAPASWYQDPQYEPGTEAPNNPGDQFSIVIDMDKLKDSDKSLDLTYSIKNMLIRYDAQISKVDSLGKPLDGAEFSIWEKSKPEDKQVVKGNAEGIFHFKELIIGKTYIIKETKTLKGYGLQSYEYNITMNMDGSFKVLRDDTQGEIITLESGKDYDWDGNALKLSFKVVNKRIYDIPITGGMGIYLYILIGTTLIGTGYNIKIKKNRGSL